MGEYMKMFCDKVSNLYRLSSKELANLVKEYNEDSSESEIKSWEISLKKLIDITYSAGLRNLFLVAEYKLPAGGRIDAVLIGNSNKGEHCALIIELKQWSRAGVEYYDKKGFPAIKVKAIQPYASRHPVNQTKEYIEALKANHENIVNNKLQIEQCQYLHEFELSEKNFFVKKEFSNIDISKMFVKGEEEIFSKFLNQYFSNDENTLISKELFIKGEYITTEIDMEIINKITESPDNIPLLHDQSKILDFIFPLLKKQADGKLNTKHLIVVTGAAGTGKTIVGFRILAEYWKLNSDTNKSNNYNCSYTLPKSRTIKQVLEGLSNNNNGIKPIFLDYIGGSKDLLVIDEAHRIDEFPQSMSTSQIIIVLQDDKQIVRGTEIGTEAEFKSYANKNNFTYVKIPLEYQKRSGLGSYVDRLDKALYGEEYLLDKGLGLNVDTVDSLEELEKWMNDCYKKSVSCKYFASYCWKWESRKDPNKIDIKITDDKYNFEKKWNPMDGQYRWYKDSIDEVGCIYTAQGLGFDYVGFIWWDDLVWRKDRWEFNVNKVTEYDYILKKSLNDNEDAEKLLLNIYRVLLTRAKKGMRIWFKDEETEMYFKKICLLEE